MTALHSAASPQVAPNLPLISMRGIGRRYGELEVLKDIDLEIREGEFVSVTGPSGSGKSTLLGVLGLLEKPTSGRYTFAARDTATLSDQQASTLRGSQLGFIFQQFHLLPTLSALENVARPLRFGGDSRDAQAQALKMLDRVGLCHRAHHRSAELSGGEQQRVAIARALIRWPKVLLADEPTGNLPPAMWSEILDLFGELHQEGHGIVLVTHDPLVAAHASRHLRLEDGKMVEVR